LAQAVVFTGLVLCVESSPDFYSPSNFQWNPLGLSDRGQTHSRVLTCVSVQLRT
jgi:hypothetical protein